MTGRVQLAVSVSARALVFGIVTPLAATLITDPAQAQLTCTTLPDGTIQCAGADTTGTVGTGVTVTNAAGPLVVTLEDGVQSTSGIALSTLTGDIDLNSIGSSLITTAGPGLIADAAANLTANVTAISTTDDGATAALLRAGDDLIFTADGTISTLGDGADGVNAQGGTVTLDLGGVTTQGVDSDGVEVLATDGPIVVTADVIDTEGDLSSAAILRGAGDINLSATALRTSGTDAVAADISSDPAACILLGAGGCDTALTADEITTEGFGGIGGLVSAAGDTTVNVGVLRTGGDEAAGLSLSGDPTACVALGVGACDTAFTVGELTTIGARSPAAIVRGAGDIDADVGVLRTSGDEAAGLDFASDPTACAILGAGACDTSFSVGELTTEGDGATGILIRSAGTTTGDVGLLSTQGDDATGIDIAGDPTACLLIGAGACDVGLSADNVSTSGDRSAAVLIDTIGNVTGDFGLLSTDGDDSTALGIFAAPAACLAIGPGACAVDAAVDEADTDGDDAPGVDVATPGPVTVDAGIVDTDGGASPGIRVAAGAEPVAISFDAITTGGDGSPGVIVTGDGAIGVTGGTVSTTGALSDGIAIDGGAGPVTVDVGAITTAGADSDGIDVATDAGAQLILAGPVTTTGPGADGIVATSGTGPVTVRARGDIRAAQGTGILAGTGGAIDIATTAGSDVSGGLAGIDATSGLGTTISLGGTVASDAGPAIDVDGAGADIVVQATGTIDGAVDLTDADDTLTNQGLIAASGDSSFGAGIDLLTNNGTLAADGAVTLAALETLDNGGLIDLADGAIGDVLTTPGNYVARPGAKLAFDVAAGTAGTPADRLVIGGTATGTTLIGLNPIGSGIVNATGTVIVDTGGGTGTFVLDGPVSAGFVDFSVAQNATGDTLLFALPNARAFEVSLLPQLAQGLWYRSADAWSVSAAQRRDDGRRSNGIGFWGQAYVGEEQRGRRTSVDLFGTPTAADLRYDGEYRGLQGGVDFRSGSNLVLGVTGGYQRNTADFNSGTRARLEGWNIGAYALYGGTGGFYGELLVKADFFDLDLANGTLFADSEIDGKSYGAEAEVGFRTAWMGANVDIGAGLAYVRSHIDDFAASGSAFELDGGDSLRAQAGMRISGMSGAFTPFADLRVYHELLGDNDIRFVSGDSTLAITDRGLGTSARMEIGVSAPNAGGLFFSGWGELGDTTSYGVRAGLRF